MNNNNILPIKNCIIFIVNNTVCIISNPQNCWEIDPTLLHFLDFLQEGKVLPQ